MVRQLAESTLEAMGRGALHLPDTSRASDESWNLKGSRRSLVALERAACEEYSNQQLDNGEFWREWSLEET